MLITTCKPKYPLTLKPLTTTFKIQLYAEKVSSRGLCAVAQCESLRYKLVGGLAVRRACYGLI